MTPPDLLLVLLVLLSTRVCPQLLVRLFAKAYPKGDPRAKEMVGEVYRIRPYQRLGWALEQAELAWFEGRQARALARLARKERAAELAARARRAQLEERARQEEAEFDAFLRGAGPARARPATPPRQRRAVLLPAVLLSASSLSFAGLAMTGPRGGGGALQMPTVPLAWNAASSADVVAAVMVAVLLLLAATIAQVLHAGLIQRLARGMIPYSGRYERPALHVANPAINVVVDHHGRMSEGLALAWGGGRVLVASPVGRAWTPATRVRRAASA